jgi:hypothetical protein
VKFILFAIPRIGAVMCVVAIFLPPDAQNPHVYADLALCVIGGLLWAMSDFSLFGGKQ